MTINIPVPSVFRREFPAWISEQFQISRVDASLFLGGTVYVLMALYPELGVYSCRIIDSQPVINQTEIMTPIIDIDIMQQNTITKINIMVNPRMFMFHKSM